MSTRSLPRQRRQTLVFLDDSRATAHVHLATEVDVSTVRIDREQRSAAGRPVSYVSYVVKAAGEIVADYPEARSVLRRGLQPSLTSSDLITAKVLYDKTVDGQRCVLSGIVPADPGLSLDEVQQHIADYRDDPAKPDGRFGDILRLQRLPVPLISVLYRLMMADPARRLRRQGTFSVTSVGHQPVRSILPLITGTLGFGLGRVVDSPVVRSERVAAAPLMTVTLTFDHRVIDGALAAEILGRLKVRLESWS